MPNSFDVNVATGRAHAAMKFFATTNRLLSFRKIT
jgi:hypothetical protein